MKHLIASFLAIASLSAAQTQQTFTGVITDDECPTTGHSKMGMGPTDPECTIGCVMSHGALYVLYDGKNVYKLSDQKTPETFAGQKVSVTGTLDAESKTIRVKSIAAAQ